MDLQKYFQGFPRVPIPRPHEAQNGAQEAELCRLEHLLRARRDHPHGPHRDLHMLLLLEDRP